MSIMIGFAPSVALSRTNSICLAQLSIYQLDALYEGLLSVAEAFAAATNVPRVQNTELHSFFSARIEAVETECDAVISELQRREPADWWEAKSRAHRLIAHAIRCGELIADIEKLAASLKPPPRRLG